MEEEDGAGGGLSGREPGREERLQERLTQLLDLPTVAPPAELDPTSGGHGSNTTDDDNGPTATAAAAAAHSSLTLDCDAIAAALGSLPLHRVLDLDPELFELAGEELVDYGDVGGKQDVGGAPDSKRLHAHYCTPAALRPRNVLSPSSAEGQTLTPELVACIDSKQHRRQQLCQKQLGGSGRFDFWPRADAPDLSNIASLKPLTTGDQSKLTVKSAEPDSLPPRASQATATSVELSRTSAPRRGTGLGDPEDELERLLAAASVSGHGVTTGSPTTRTSNVTLLSQSLASTAPQGLDARVSVVLPSASDNPELLDDMLDELLA